MWGDHLCRWRQALIALLLTLSTGAMPEMAHAKVLDQHYVGPWSIEAYPVEGGTEFGHCTMSAEYADGVSLVFYLGREFHWGIGLLGEKWKLTEGDKYEIRLSVDKGKVSRLTAEALDPQLVYIAIAGGGDLFEELRSGRDLHIEAAGDSFLFGLNGTSRGLLALYDCVDQHVLEANDSNPFVAPSQKARSGSAGNGADETAGDWGVGQGDYRAESERVLNRLLSAAGITQFEIVPDTDPTDAMEGFNTVWRSDGLLGGLFVIPEGERHTAEDMLVRMAKSQADDCQGKFASNIETTARVNGAYMPRAYAGCSDGAGSSLVYFSAFQRRQGGFYIFFTAALDGDSPGAATDADARIRDAAYSVQ